MVDRSSDRRFVAGISQAIWHRFPMRPHLKSRLKGWLFERYPVLFRWTDAYRAWEMMNGPTRTLHVGRSLNSAPSNGDRAYVPLLRSDPPAAVPVRLIAFYLPQFHSIKENDEWWGEGFTEWTNVKPALPQFAGHYQPHLPDELGYYSLLDASVQRRQIELAKLYGVGGFCFYYYWFGGKRLLEQPIENYLADESLNFPFCLCWANENWSRRWDGKDSQILIAQNHSPEDDLAVAADLARYVRDERYIRINGKPLIVVYRPSLLPSAKETSDRWRNWFREHGIGEIYLAYTQSFETVDPEKYGFDAAIEFPPNNSGPPIITDRVKKKHRDFDGIVYDWSVLPERAKKYRDVGYRLFRSVCPSWDNTARRKSKGAIFVNSTPDAYQGWLEDAVSETCRTIDSVDERIVFVNAWNEWAEGAHLEPDQKYGYAWLDATRRALTGETGSMRKIAVVSHDAHPHGAQFLALGMVRALANDMKFAVDTVILGEGRLSSEFASYSTVHQLLPGDDFDDRAELLAQQLQEKGIRSAIVNTTVSGKFLRVLAEHGITGISLVHEMPGVIEAANLADHAREIAQYADRVVFPAPIVAEGFQRFASISEDKVVIRPQGLWRRNPYRLRGEEIRAEVRAELGVGADAPIILAVGYADRRKGIDFFAKAAMHVLEGNPSAIFIWIGHWDEALRGEISAIIAGRESAFRFLGFEPDTARYHVAADVFALTSREDPFPNVVIESFDASVPVVAFAGTGGGAALVSKVGGQVVPAEDYRAFARAIGDLLESPEKARKLGRDASALADTSFAFRDYLFHLCALTKNELPKISVVVPNYNYARHLRDRLDSIVNQTLPIYELIILDDASTDDSIAVISEWAKEHAVECRIVVNDTNSGSVFKQWAKGVEVARGDFIWIAEADDLSAPEFLETVLAPMERDAEVNLSYCESQQIDENGRRLSRNYNEYLRDFPDNHWQVPYIARGEDEIRQYLAVQNTIPNVSGVLFRRNSIASVLIEHFCSIHALKRAGDWLTYVRVLQTGKVAFSPRALNFHRRHVQSVVGGSTAAGLIDEISTVQGLIGDIVQLPEETTEKAEGYLTRLRNEVRM
ncbi:hypothetical protein ATY79_14960 [Rhizobium sp. R693]|nr:hypothetical protein ATY79_14960 [Rhizobium sp. R693]